MQMCFGIKEGSIGAVMLQVGGLQVHELLDPIPESNITFEIN